MAFAIIAALGPRGELGLSINGVPSLPWPAIRGDQQFFRAVTTAVHPERMASCLCRDPSRTGTAGTWHTEGNAVICGRVTYETLPQRSLAQRTLIVLQREGGKHPLTPQASSLEAALACARTMGAPNVFVIGGQRPYADALAHPECTTLFLTEITPILQGQILAAWPGTLDDMRRAFTYSAPASQGGQARARRHVFMRDTTSDWLTDPENGISYRFGIWKRIFRDL